MLNRRKVLAIMLIFTMTFTNFAFVTESIAATSFASIFGGNGTGSDNVEFEAYLSNNSDQTSNTLVSDVNNDNLAVQLQLDVKNSGYLKNAKVEIKAKENSDLNFIIKENKIAEMPNVQSLENNVLTLNKIEHTSDKMNISIPIGYENEEYIKESKLLSTAKVILSGTYIGDNGKEHKISKEVELTLAWKDERAVRIKDEVTKYIQFGNDGVILQTLVKIDSSNSDKNTLPVRETELNIDIPKINDVAPKEIAVIANSTVGTNGKGVGEVEFNNDNWSYNQKENKLNIKIQNKKQLVDIKKQEYLKVEGEDTKKEERYYSKAGTDEYVITYTYKNLILSDEMKMTSKVDAKLTTLSGVQADGNSSVISAEKNGNYNLTGQTGNLVSYNIENETKSVSKVYAYLGKEVEYNSKTVINVSYKDIVEGITVEDVKNYYMDKAENKVETDDITYKQIYINKDNFNEILGERGFVQISDTEGNEIAIVNKDYEVDQNGNYVVNLEDKVSRIVIQTSAPINNGNLVISNKKSVSNISVQKYDYANMEYLMTETAQKAKFSYVSENTNLGNCTIKTKLKDTKTDFNLNIDRDSLSTITPNSNVEIRLELNNDEENSDIYGNSIFEIEMPEYITDLNVTNASMIYGEGLNIENIDTYVRDGKPIIRVTIDGKQTDLNTGVLTNGTNIVLNADIVVDKYTPTLEKEVKAYAFNSEATNYTNPVEYSIENNTFSDYKEEKIEYSAPSGLITINTVANYNQLGSSLTSIKQGEQVDYIDIYSEAKTATMEVVAINNNDTTVKDLSILGRIPFKGVKDLSNGKDLGTTLDTKMISGIVCDASNEGDFIVYYSENKEATKDLNNSENGWVQNPASLDNIKSYLIVPSDAGYQMDAKQVLKFTYEYQIPENLNHNEDIYGTFLAYYTSTKSAEEISETSKPDLVGLTTGAGPKLEMEIQSDKTEVKELEEFTTTVTVKNAGSDIARDVNVEIPTPVNSNYVSAKANRETINVVYTNGKIIANVGQLGKSDTFDIETTFKANNTTDIIEKKALKVKEENNEENIKFEALAVAKDLEKPLSKNIQLGIKESKLQLTQRNTDDYPDRIFSKGMELEISLYATNLLKDNEQKNVKVVSKLPNTLNFSKAYMVGNSNDMNNIENAVYDSSSRTVTWTIDKLEANSTQGLILYVTVGDLNSGVTETEAKISSEIFADGTEKYKAEDVTINLGKGSLSVVQTSSTSTYVYEGDIINYTFSIKNEGSSDINDAVLTDIVPDGLVVTNLAFSINGENNEVTMSENENAELDLSIPANSQVDVNVTARASELNGMQEKTVTNEGKITSSGSDEIKSNSVTHIIKSSGNDSNGEGVAGDDERIEGNLEDITKSYKISGTAWIDSNKDGMRDGEERKMSDVTAMLVDSSSGTIKSTVKTDNNGEYAFTGLRKGSYLILFKYDTINYTTTTYQKEGIESNINSDVVTTKIEQDGRKENGAVTDTIVINGASIANIDIGLIESDKFSLQLDKSISKVTVQNSKGTKTEEFDKAKLAKYEIGAKYLSGTTVYVEYTINVKNNGDLSGFASEVMDYIPQGMTFNSNLNTDWYTGTDGSLYTKALADKELAPGESQEIKLVLTKQMTAENTGLVSNTAEIADDFNIYGMSDCNSKPANKAQGEDDMSTADTIIGIKTGESLIYISAIIISILIGGAVAFVINEKVLKNKRGGV